MLSLMSALQLVLAGETVERATFFGVQPTQTGLVALGVIVVLVLWAGFSFVTRGLVYDLVTPMPDARRVRR